VRLKLDENIGRRWLQQLRDATRDVDNVWDEALSGASDVDVLAAAARERRAFVTLDLDVANPLRFPPSETSGIVVLRVREGPDRGALDAVIGRLTIALAAADVTGHLWIVERHRVRQYEAPAD
jgi:predicted nuclease of predicted toxin-antitoxin system